MSGWVITVYHAIGFCQRMGSSFWSDVCKAAVTQSPLRKTTTSNALCGAIVALYALAFLASSYRVRQFMSIQPQNKTKVWPRFRVFNTLLMCASVFGSVAWASNVQNTQLQFQAGSLNTANTLNGTFRPTPPDVLFQIKRLAAESASWSASFFVFSALEFAAVSISQMLILDRLLSFLLKSTSLLSEQRRYTNVWQGALALVAAANAVGVCASLAAAASQAQASFSFLTAASAYARGDIAAAEEQNNSAEAFVLRAAETSSIQRITEALVGVTMLVFFALFGIASVKMLRHVVELTSKKNLMTNVSAVGKFLQRRIITTVAVVFATILFRAIFSTWYAAASIRYSAEAKCSKNACDPCFSDLKLQFTWMFNAQEFKLCVYILNGPLALMVSLWGMTLEFSRIQKKNSNQTVGATLLFMSLLLFF